MPTSPTRLFVCDHCGATLPVEPEHAGRKCRCGRCGEILTVPGDSPDTEPKPTPKHLGFGCQLCGTRMFALARDVGRKARCPDCGVLTVVPQPPKPRPKQIPKAMYGQQYGLWEVDEAPLPAEIAARQPKFFPVWCRICNTLMHAQAKQVGKRLMCPDCGGKTLVEKPPPEKKEAPSVLVPDGDEYQLDETAAPTPRPLPVSPAVLDAQKHAQHREGLHQEYGGRPKMPRFPTLTGVAPLLLRSPVTTWWVGLSCALSAIGVLGGASGGAATGGGGFDAIMGVCFLAMACIFGILWFAGSSALWCAVLTESSEGSDRLYHPPSGAPYEWFGPALYIALSSTASLIPGWALGTFLLFFQPDISMAISPPAIGMPLGMFFFFPIALLSAMERSSPLEIVSLPILRSLLRRPGHWLLFYLETALLFGLFLLSVGALQGFLFAVLPLGMAVSLIYFRLLGRLAWWLAESLPLSEDTNR